MELGFYNLAVNKAAIFASDWCWATAFCDSFREANASFGGEKMCSLNKNELK
jgi:hypothetical protein